MDVYEYVCIKDFDKYKVGDLVFSQRLECTLSMNRKGKSFGDIVYVDYKVAERSLKSIKTSFFYEEEIVGEEINILNIFKFKRANKIVKRDINLNILDEEQIRELHSKVFIWLYTIDNKELLLSFSSTNFNILFEMETKQDFLGKY